MEDEPYIPPQTNKTFQVNVDKDALERLPKVEYRQPLQWRRSRKARSGSECNDGADGQDGAQTDCSGDCHAYFA
jgi:hypothetical protein